MKNKVFILFLILFLLFSTTVIGIDTTAVEEINSDLYIDEDNYNLNSKINGNTFLVVKDFVLSDTSSIDGDLFVVANTVTLKSDVSYIDSVSKHGEDAIDKIISHSSVNGNVYVVCKEFTLETGSEISGDLYVVAETLNIKRSAKIGGNIFAVSKNFNLDGKVSKSVYASSEKFSMSYFGSIGNDIHLVGEDISLNSFINRNMYVTAETFETDSDFRLSGDLELDALNVNFAGQIEGNASINTKELNFVNRDETQNLILGNLKYSTPKEIEIKENIVKGETTYSTYKERNVQEIKSHPVKDFILSLITFVLYVFVTVWLFKIFAKKYSNAERKISVKDSFIELGIGLLSIICIIITTVILLLTGIGSTVGVILIIAYILVLLLATPLFVLDINNMLISGPLNGKINFYLLLLLTPMVMFLIKQIPFIGGLVSFLFVMIGTGRIIRNLLKRS